jgi:ribA/ribD-fused uncharacterized protein
MKEFPQEEVFTFFWRNKSPFSQWYQGAPFVLHGITFRDAETYMMWYKDQVFGGTLEKEILATTKPSDVKALGRLVPGFQKSIWDAVARIGVFRGNIAKFSQNSDILPALLNTKGTTLVEASPNDTIWGIGLEESDPRAHSRVTWCGTNWLGEVLTDVRDTILSC